MSAQNSAGIQTLLDAEREASKIVQRAREFRTKRVKEARDEAKREIAEYKARKEDEFKKFEAEVTTPQRHLHPSLRSIQEANDKHSKGNEAAQQEANKEAEKQIEVIKQAGQKNQATVVKHLLDAVFEVKPLAA
ncbi:hypothetical protein CCMA1212_008434 [Trichoderma ghanense]|uniref:V-type proton ATPase subunit G n=1 Tax=Trichoderma ghanense TaxID=65468 RepID=A0ABY2GUL4_9HYPO